MRFIYLLIFILIILVLHYYYKKYQEEMIEENDYNYFQKFVNKENLYNLLNNNKLESPTFNKYNILFLTFDNRPRVKYMDIHDANIKKYCDKYGYEYTFLNKCSYNAYWCKIYLVLDALKSGKYDYVIWLDTDTVIKDFSVNIGDILNKYSSDILIGSDNNKNYGLVNSGVFIIKNSAIGKNFLQDCINYAPSYCMNWDGSVKGYWAASCYEQGVMNLMIADKYSDHTTVLPNDIIFNFNICSDNVFIMHNYASNNKNRVKCLTSGIKE